MSSEDRSMLTDNKTFTDAIHLTEEWTKQTVLDLNNTAVIHEDLQWFLVNKDKEKVYTLSLNSLDQICKIAKVPTGFLLKNPETLSNSLMDFWFPPEVGIEPTVVRYYNIPDSPIPIARGFIPEKDSHDLMGYHTFWDTLRKQLMDKTNTTVDLVYAEGYELPAPALITRFKFVEDAQPIYSDDESISVIPSLTVAYSDCGGLKNFIIETGYMALNLPLHTNIVFRPERAPYYSAKTKVFNSEELDRVLKYTMQDSYRYLWNPEGKKRIISFLRDLNNKSVSSADFNSLEATSKLYWVEKMLDFKGFPSQALKQFQTKIKEGSVEATSMLDVYFGMLEILSSSDLPLPKRVATEANLTSFFRSIFN